MTDELAVPAGRAVISEAPEGAREKVRFGGNRLMCLRRTACVLRRSPLKSLRLVRENTKHPAACRRARGWRGR